MDPRARVARALQVFFTLQLWLLGALACRSGAVPPVLAAGPVLAGTGCLIDLVRASPLLEAAGIALLAVVASSTAVA
ncbi:hypothetical protein [Jannaschia formosa]|uniref:hypothetical protein n=1 Tax=Jannaschia formosa TaxID=2259592 RepID=UPI000E1B6F8A|nr:hypothetical protein [Jannaschia formosa]TFL19801.1 hypothetical protein DR046_00155 [Jannaschia formosa]